MSGSLERIYRTTKEYAKDNYRARQTLAAIMAAEKLDLSRSLEHEK